MKLLMCVRKIDRRTRSDEEEHRVPADGLPRRDLKNVGCLARTTWPVLLAAGLAERARYAALWPMQAYTNKFPVGCWSVGAVAGRPTASKGAAVVRRRRRGLRRAVVTRTNRPDACVLSHASNAEHPDFPTRPN